MNDQNMQWEIYKSDLYWALRTRVLTEDEMNRVRGLGYLITVRDGQPFYQDQKINEFNQALMNQYQMQLAEKKSQIPEDPFKDVPEPR